MCYTHTHTHIHPTQRIFLELSVDHRHHSFLSLNSSVCVPNEGISYNHNTDFNFSKFKLTQFYLIYHEYSNVVNWPSNVFYSFVLLLGFVLVCFVLFFLSTSAGSIPGSGITFSSLVSSASLNIFVFYGTDILEEYSETEVFCTNKWLIERLVLIGDIEITLYSQIVNHDNGR